MFTQTSDTIIIGGGLSGLYAAYLLTQKKLPFVILEARSRMGGRILTGKHQDFFPDLGPSWYWPEINPKMMHLIQTLGLRGYQQFEQGMGRFETAHGLVQTVRGYTTQPACWRLNQGMTALITTLEKKIPQETIRLNSPVCEIERKKDHTLVSIGESGETPRAQFRSPRVILALPPRLAAATILFTPDLSFDLTQAMLKMGTWMAGQAKFYTLYPEANWRQKGFSGQAFSQRGPLGEIHDGSNKDLGPYGLTGFFNIPAAQRNGGNALTQAILVQLAAIYGPSAAQPTQFYYQDWAREKYTATQYDQPTMHEHPLYQPPAGQTAIWNGLVQFAGSETADRHGGYLEGALNSAQRAVANI
jgi:monoamine oxidase